MEGFTIFGCIMLLGWSTYFGYQAGEASANDDIITECERTLPRDEHCIVIAVPKPPQDKESE